MQDGERKLALEPRATWTPLRQLVLVVGALSWLTFAYFGSTPSWNPNSRFALVRAMVEHQTFAIDPYEESTGDKSFHDGHYYSDKAPGLAFVAAPFYLLRYWLDPEAEAYNVDPTVPLGALYLCTILTVGLASALATVAVLLLARQLGARPRYALLVALVFAAGTPALAYSSSFFSHQFAGALLISTLALWTLGKEAASPNKSVLGGALLSWAVMSEYTAAIAVLALVAYRLRDIRTIAAGAREALRIVMGALPGALLLAGYNTICFGAPWRIGYATLAPSRFQVGMSRGFFGVGWPQPEVLYETTFGGMRGLFVVSPILLLCALGLGRLALVRSPHRALGLTSLAIVTGYWLLNGSYVFWNGGAAFGPRHMVPMLPFLVLGLVALPQARPWRAAVALLALPSCAFALAAIAMGADLPEYGHAVLDHVWPAWRDGTIPFQRYAYNLGQIFGLTGRASLIPLAAFWALALPLPLTLARRAEEALG